MTLYLRNTQKIIIFSLKQFERDVNILRAAAGIRQHDLGILCADTTYIQQLQKDIEVATEGAKEGVLTFPYNEKSLYWSPGEMPSPKVMYNLGDIILDLPKIYHNSKEERLSIYPMLTMMTTKGISRLLGNSAETSYRKELEILERYNRLTGSNLHPLLEENSRLTPTPSSTFQPEPQQAAVAM